jgi:hypothetical protein
MHPDSLQPIRAALAVVLGRQPGDLAAAIRELDAARPRAGGDLGHYLARRSYQKAWILLEGGDPEAGGCGS